MKIAIVGGGITGLSLGFFLSKKGHKVSLFEKADHLGGLISTFSFGETRIEKLYHHLFTADREALELISELNLKDKLVWSRSTMAYYSGGKLYPFTSPWDLMNFSPIPFISRIKLGLLSLAPKPSAGLSAREYLISQIGETAYKVVWEPLLTAKFGQYNDSVPAEWVAARLLDRKRSRGLFSERLGYLRGSFQVLIEALAGKINDIHLSHHIQDAEELKAFDKVIFTSAPRSVKYLGNICVALEVDSSLSDSYWINLGDAGFSFCAIIDHDRAFRDNRYQNKKMIYLSKYLDPADDLWKMGDRDIYDIFLKDLNMINQGFKCLKYRITRELKAQPLIQLGYQIPPFEIEPGRIYQVNNAQIYPQDRGINNSIRLARQFADLL